MDKSTISGWVRQARHRAKKHDIYNEIEISDIEEIVEFYGGNCAYSGQPAETLDHPFPLKDSAPNVAANVVPCSKESKAAKKGQDLVWMYSNKMISQERYVELISEMLSRPGGEQLKEHIKNVTGFLE